MSERITNDFLIQRMLESQGQAAAQPTRGAARGQSRQSDFSALLQRELTAQQAAQTAPQVAFSRHARERATQRGIEITPTLMTRLQNGIDRARAKGATNVIAMDAAADQAFLLNIPQSKVITAITSAEMRESVFTNIDGAVFL